MREMTGDIMMERIDRLEPIDAVSSHRSFRIKIQRYQPLVAAALHQGQRRISLRQESLPSQDSVGYPETADWLESYPFVILGMDSPLDCDLHNRPIRSMNPRGARTSHSQASTRSIERHETFYHLFSRVIRKLEKIFGFCIIHSVRVHRDKTNGQTGVAPIYLDLRYTPACLQTETLNQWQEYLVAAVGRDQVMVLPSAQAELPSSYLVQVCQRRHPHTLVLDHIINESWLLDQNHELRTSCWSSWRTALDHFGDAVKADLSRYFRLPKPSPSAQRQQRLEAASRRRLIGDQAIVQDESPVFGTRSALPDPGDEDSGAHGLDWPD